MHHSKHVDVAIGGKRVNDKIRQSDDRKLPRSTDLSGTTKKRELPEHHRRLHYSDHYPFGGSRVIFSDPVANGAKVISRLRREVNRQSSVRVAPVQPGSSTTDPAPA